VLDTSSDERSHTEEGFFHCRGVLEANSSFKIESSRSTFASFPGGVFPCTGRHNEMPGALRMYNGNPWSRMCCREEVQEEEEEEEEEEDAG